MNQFRPGAVLAAVPLCVLAFAPHGAVAAVEVHKLNLVLSAMPSQVKGGDYNLALDQYNRTNLDPRGYEGLGKIQFAWQFDAELRYFVRPNFAVDAGVSHLRATTRREFLPALSQGIVVSGEVLTAPVHVGAAYYLQPYNQGDFRAQVYFGGGMMQYTYTHARLQQVENGTDTLTTLGGNFKVSTTQDGPGYYGEGGVQMYFASRYSVMLSAYYRSGELRNVFDETTGQPALLPNGSRVKLDVGGISLRAALSIGL